VSGDEQLSLAELPPAQARSTAQRARKERRRVKDRNATPAVTLPIAKVAVDVPLAHLDRSFDYLVTAKQDKQVTPGCRVRVRFAGQLVDGFVLDRVASPDHPGRLSPLASVVSAEPVLTDEVARLVRTVADHYAGTMADVLRLAVPPRHAAVERDIAVTVDPAADVPMDATAWTAYRRGPAFLRALADGRSPRAAWSALPGVIADTPRWVGELVAAVLATLASGRQVLLVVPDLGDVDYVARVLRAHLDEGIVELSASLGPKERYRRWLAARRGLAQVVVGTRAAVYTPLQKLGLIAIWDDGDDSHAEPRAPYPHVREVAALRSHLTGCGLLIGAHARTAEVAAMVERGFLHSVHADRSTVRSAAPRISASGDDTSAHDRLASSARLPNVAWRATREALSVGPVLFQVPRRGYVPRLVCDRCQELARCEACHGPLGLPDEGAVPTCRWCGTIASAWRCSSCGADRCRSVVIGARRTAEELGRAFPGVPVVMSGGRNVRASVDALPAIVVATPGAEPLARGGYAAAVLLDIWALLGRADMRAHEETLRRWMAAASLVRSSAEGGRVVVVGDAASKAVQALIRWDPRRYAETELEERRAVGLPPASRVAVLRGTGPAVADLQHRLQLPDSAEILGPVEISGEADAQVMVRTAPEDGAALASAIRHGQGERSVRKLPDHVAVRIDPVGWL
jgi:primosomal protein N' (replication factor Y)